MSLLSGSHVTHCLLSLLPRRDVTAVSRCRDEISLRVSHTKNVTSPGISVSLPRRDMPRISVSRRSPQTKARKTFCAPEAPRTLYLLLSLGSPDTPPSRKTPTRIVVLVKTSVTPGVERQSKGQLVRPGLSMAAAQREECLLTSRPCKAVECDGGRLCLNDLGCGEDDVPR